MSDQARAKELLELYRNNRVDSQRKWYKNRADRNEQRDTLLRITSGVLLLSLGLIPLFQNGLPGEPDSTLSRLWIVLPAAIPALATALQTLRSIFQYENTQYLYRQTYFALGKISNSLDLNENDPELAEKLKYYIEQVEGVIAAENGQWVKGEAQTQMVDRLPEMGGYTAAPPSYGDMQPVPSFSSPPPYTAPPLDIPPSPPVDAPPYEPVPLPPDEPLDSFDGDIPDGPSNPPPSERA